ncbi:2-hydroxyglutaryl-CoA dehydratase, D-component [Pseudoflavonifractor capillosus ATCC 29799]|uniref:2-hydroxyglutaryl-CoA dehydratase, D-component n=1 Tax=Pseudoflavonifractor capillosus ATCC 29799 TaxID=411467 RepID=A6P2L9_9FIRM|nr:2-hydroxyacyl-CoA dehydratase family protein [Pseudoflavonifractor capillosus]EDM97419.1 2-hydroxyglutaryl-CoA dehydratase, D-component [Pseudoflavonifractor capillosus ATCC 29799]
MRDLKHLYYFEKLLDDANNELVRQAKADGRLALGYTCYHMPEVLLNLEGCFSVRLRAPRTGSMEVATYYMSNATCEYARALLERGLEGGYKFLDAMAGVDVCECMNRSMENMELLGVNDPDKKNFFWCNLDSPCSDNEDCVEHLREQLSRKILKPLREDFGIDTSDQAIRDAVARHNEVCRLITEIGNYRKLDNPTITGYEFHILTLATYVCPKDLVVEKLRETLEELKTREPDPKKNFRAKVVVVGSEIDDPELISLIEDSGALVVADRFCYGSFPGRQEIVLTDDEDALTQVCRNYLQTTLCVRHSAQHKVQKRLDFAAQLAKDYHADGIIYEQIKFCTYWSYERALASHIMHNEYNIPTLSIDRPYMSRTSGQLRTRVQAFVESIEIKKIKAKRGQEVK